MSRNIYTWLMCQTMKGGDMNICLNLEFENHVLWGFFLGTIRFFCLGDFSQLLTMTVNFTFHLNYLEIIFISFNKISFLVSAILPSCRSVLWGSAFLLITCSLWGSNIAIGKTWATEGHLPTLLIKVISENGNSSVCVLNHFRHVRLFVTLWILARQTPLSMGFSGQEY